MTTLRTSLRRIFRIDRHDQNARHRPFILNECPQLVETPSTHLRALILPEPCPLADTSQVFNTDSASGVCSLLNELFTDDVVYVPAKTGFLARQIPDLAADGFWAMAFRFSLRRRLLQGLALLVAFLARSLNAGATESGSIRVGSDIFNPQIHADEIGSRRGRFVGQVHTHEQKPFAVLAANQIALTAFPVESFRLVFTHDERNDDPAF